MSPIPEKENTHRGAPSRNYILLYRESIKNKKTVTKKKKKKKKKIKKKCKKKRERSETDRTRCACLVCVREHDRMEFERRM